MRQTGGELRRPHGDIDFEDEWADRAYDSFRASDDELPAVAATAREYGFTAEDIAKIKNHVFRDEHLLDMDARIPRPTRQDLRGTLKPQRAMGSAINERTDVFGGCGRCRR